MLPLRRGTIIFVGSTSGMVGRPNHLNLAVGKFGLRALSQVMARELLPNRIHVVHLVIDGEIQEEPTAESSDPELCPEDICDLIYSLYRQPMSTWTSEFDVAHGTKSFGSTADPDSQCTSTFQHAPWPIRYVVRAEEKSRAGPGSRDKPTHA